MPVASLGDLSSLLSISSQLIAVLVRIVKTTWNVTLLVNLLIYYLIISIVFVLAFEFSI